ncbi:hypothetical protein KIW84_022879 [Lathyrus oleraceus]|uniref:Uncharacterized protein n=1 Tax=Pisum sativum TaxID=3888 RepID=A0A9D4YBI9_PEA|nr:hypothetical protein KIW84_022879 [Pisum sativum]
MLLFRGAATTNRRVLVVSPAGNEGILSSATNLAPWMLIVAVSSTDRDLTSAASASGAVAAFFQISVNHNKDNHVAASSAATQTPANAANSNTLTSNSLPSSPSFITPFIATDHQRLVSGLSVRGPVHGQRVRQSDVGFKIHDKYNPLRLQDDKPVQPIAVFDKILELLLLLPLQYKH